MAQFDYPQAPLILEDTDTGVWRIPLADYFDCRDFDIFDPATDCAAPYSPSYCFPFAPGDRITIQVNTPPVLVEFFELDGTQQVIPYTLTGRTLYIEATDIPGFIQAFIIQLDGVCTYGYTREPCPDVSTVSIESSYVGRDPLGFDHSAPYSNATRLRGGFVLQGLRTENTTTPSGRLVSSTVYERFVLRSGAMPTEIWRFYANVLQGSRVKVNGDGREYSLVSLADRSEKGQAHIDAVLERFVSRQNFC